MKKVILFFKTLICMGCFYSCTDKQIVVELWNETTDTLYVWSHYNMKEYPWPDEGEVHITLNPFSKNERLIEKSHLESTGFGYYVVRKTMADSLSIDTVIKRRLYDIVYRYSYDELEARDYIIKVRQDDLNVH